MPKGKASLLEKVAELFAGGEIDPRYTNRPSIEQKNLRVAKSSGGSPRKTDIPSAAAVEREIIKRNMPELPEISIFDLEGHPVVSTMSDRMDAGKTLVGVKGQELSRPVDLYGGQDYMIDPATGEALWASAEKPIQDILARAARQQRHAGNRQPLFMPWRMAPTGKDFSSATGETMINFASAVMDKGDKKKLDTVLKMLMPEWKGIDHPDAIRIYQNADANARKEALFLMDKDFRKAGGLTIGEARMAVSDPRQVNLQDAGVQNVGLIDVGAGAGKQSNHPSYPNTIYGQPLGRIKENITIADIVNFPNRDVDPRNITSGDIRAMQMKPYGGVIGDRLLRQIEKMIEEGKIK